MEDKQVANRYASSLFKVLDDPIVISQLKIIAEMFEEKIGIQDYFDKETITDEERGKWIEKELHSFLPEIKKFIYILDEKKRMSILNKIALEYERLVHDKNVMERIYIRTATPVSDESIKKVAHFFEEKLGKALRPVPIVDPDLIGGVSVQVEGRLYDDSIQSKLRKMLNDLDER